jgi:RimJ/RimL family protein N-acetyltransferase
LTELTVGTGLTRWFPEPLETDEVARRFVPVAMELETKGQALPFALVERQSGRIAGSTRYLNIVPEHRRLEIGYTFVGAAWQRTTINSAAKLLLLAHAFERLGCIRVELKTDARNAQSRAAIARLGAQEEGYFRRHMICADGSLRDTVYLSIVADEWPSIKARLVARFC